MGVYLVMVAAPLLLSGWFKLSLVRTGVIIAGLLLINLLTWSGYLWVIWPAAALLAVELLRRLMSGSR